MTMKMMMKSVLLVIAILLTLSNGLVSPTATASPKMSTARAASRDALVMMPATLEKDKVRTPGPAVLDRPTTTERKNRSPNEERSNSGDDSWEVRIYNDGMNTREHVARSLVKVTGLSEMSAYQTMMRAHQDGIATV